MANKTIGELQAVPVGELPVAPDIYDETLIPVEQEGKARHMTGAQWKAYGVAAAKAEADRAEAAAIRQPTIGTDGTWLVWDANAEAYVDTGLPARGEKGGKGDKGDPGEPGKNGTDGDDGAPGKDGKDGITPHIGENGNWYVGETDTGVEATAGSAAAEAAADASQKSASAAETAKGEAEKSASAAGTSAESASNSATAAQDAKTAAENAAADAHNEASYCASASRHVENLKNDTETAAEEAKQAITLWPIISEKTGTWLVYQASVGDYVDTGENAQGPAGEDGIAPHIGSNGNWFIGEEDTGISATGPKGGKGDTGATGPQGESIANVTSFTDPLDANNNLVAFYLSNGQQVGSISVRNGSKGDKGDTGPAGPAGADGKNGKDGAAGKDGTDGKDGADGQRGTGTLKVTTQPSSYTTAIGDYTPKYRIALATVISQSKKTEVLLGDLIQYSYYQYQVDYLDDTYAYISATRVSIRGATGAEGAAGATGPQGPAGPAGSDANVTAANIKSALGYTPADAADLEQLNNEKVVLYSEAQDLTEEQKAQARANIGAMVEGAMGESEQLQVAYATTYVNTETFTYTEATTENYAYCVVKPGELKGGLLSVDFNPAEIPEGAADHFQLVLHLIDEDGNPYKFTGASTTWGGEEVNPTYYDPSPKGQSFGKVTAPFTVKIPNGCVPLISTRCVTSGSAAINRAFNKWLHDGGVTFTVSTKAAAFLKQNVGTEYAGQYLVVDEKGNIVPSAEGGNGGTTALTAAINPNVKSVNHRGFGTAPENTLAAFRLSKKMGFDIAECDVRVTSDGHYVLLHDSTVDRTSEGTGAVASLTFDYVRGLDFGSYKSADYAGEQIPTFDECMRLCRDIGLYMYIDMKISSATQAIVNDLVNIVKKYRMQDKVTWLSHKADLTLVRNADPSARLALIAEDVNSTMITNATALKNDTNEVIIDAGYSYIDDSMVDMCREADIPLEIYGLNTATAIINSNAYISGFTTDTVIAGVELYKSAMGLTE